MQITRGFVTINATLVVAINAFATKLSAVLLMGISRILCSKECLA